MAKLLGDKTLEILVSQDRLKRADVLVTRSKGSLLGWLIRFGTRSYWNHALMIYVIRNDDQGYKKTFIIESGGTGIDIHDIAHYLQRTKRFDIGIKRLERPWFQNSHPDGLRYPRRIRGLALQEIDDKYDYRLIVGIARRMARQIILGLLYPWQRRKPVEQRRVSIPKLAKQLDVSAYICSGFVQWSYYNSVKEIMEQEQDPDKDKLKEVIFNPAIHQDDAEDVLLSTTPADLANSDRLSWKYIVKNGKVWEVEGKTPDEQRKEVEQIIAT